MTYTATDLLPLARVLDADDYADAPLGIANVSVGDTVAAYVRGRMRPALVVKVGTKNVKVLTTTPTAVAEAREAVATFSAVRLAKRTIESDRRNAARYREMADVIEAEGYEPTVGREGFSAFVPESSVPKLAALETSHNYARTTIVYPAADYREWADKCDEHAARELAKMPEYEALDARTPEEKFAARLTTTEKSVPADKVYAITAAH